MPTFKQAIDADPGKFGEVGSAISGAAGDLDHFVSDYADCIEALAADWEGGDYAAAASWLPSVKGLNTAAQTTMTAGSATLQASSAAMKATVEVLKQTKQAAESAGYKVMDMPMVMLGSRQWQQVSSAGYGAPAVYAAYQAGAVAFTGLLVAQLAVLNAADVAGAGGLHAAAFAGKTVGTAAGAAQPSVTTAGGLDAWR
ncbi:hypothetical protein [Glycomyces buryatensis]|uniref:Uncharacterized protein n=1 Tax=Glycomyces buryatensis TaxID=2570927 RepID=A0A4S8QDU7_9ACTN|nr:hypothetical protein [Glycomyces buryatensis]THV42757.1 hypothetical protein FAB82_04735 [Glycomyces buryatensis]